MGGGGRRKKGRNSTGGDVITIDHGDGRRSEHVLTRWYSVGCGIAIVKVDTQQGPTDVRGEHLHKEVWTEHRTIVSVYLTHVVFDRAVGRSGTDGVFYQGLSCEQLDAETTCRTPFRNGTGDIGLQIDLVRTIGTS